LKWIKKFSHVHRKPLRSVVNKWSRVANIFVPVFYRNWTRTGHIAKMFVSTKFKKISEDEAKEEPTEAYIPDPLVVVTYVPEILHEKLSAQDWHNAITGELITIQTEVNGAFVYGIYRHPEPFKGQDELVCKSFAFLKTRKLYIEQPASEDECDELLEFRQQLV